MAAGRGSKVEWTDYKLIQETVSKVLGTGTGSFGYGQTIASGAVTQYQKITETQWSQVREDILRCRMHQTGVDYSGSLTVPTTSVKIVESDRLAYLNMAQLSETNALVSPPSTQATRLTLVKSIYEDSWNTSVGLTEIVDFGTYNAARYFFNSGGQIEISSSRVGGTSPSPKNSTWSTMLSTMGTIVFNYTSTTKTGSSGTGTAYGYYDLTTTDIKIFEQNAPVGGSYSLNKYVINAKINATGSQVIFTIQYLDLATYTNTTVYGPGLGPYGSDEYVDGTLTSEIKTYRATAPDGILSVTVDNPTVQTSDNWSVIEGGSGSTTAPSVNITPTSLSNPQVEVAYSQQFSATGGTAPYIWSYTGGLPAGLSLSSTGLLSGTPATASGYSFSVYASDATGFVGNKSYTVTVARPTITVTPTTISNPKVGTAYGVSFAATGGTGPYSWQSSGSVPPGLSLTTGGVLSGTPTTSGSYTFTVTVYDRYSAPGSRSYTVTVASASVVAISPTSISGLKVGYEYSQQFTATGGTAPYTWTSSGAVPAGLIFDSSGLLSGTPTTQTSYSFNIIATDGSAGAYSRTNAYSVTVAAPDLPPVPVITVTPTTPGSMSVDVAYSKQYAASGGTVPYYFSVIGVLPPGLSISPSGLVSGTPTSSAGGVTYNYGIRATDAGLYNGTRDVSVTVTAAPAPVTYMSPTSATGYVSYGDSFNTASSGQVGFQVVCSSSYGLVNLTGSSTTGGTAITNVDEFSISAGNQRTVLLNWSEPSGVVSNPFRFSVVSNRGGTFSYTVNRVFVSISSPAPGSYSGFTINTAYSYTLTATGGTGPYTWDVVSGTIVPGWEVTSGGTMGGTIASYAGKQTYIWTVRAIDANGIAGTGKYTAVVS